MFTKQPNRDIITSRTQIFQTTSTRLSRIKNEIQKKLFDFHFLSSVFVSSQTESKPINQQTLEPRCHSPECYSSILARERSATSSSTHRTRTPAPSAHRSRSSPRQHPANSTEAPNFINSSNPNQFIVRTIEKKKNKTKEQKPRRKSPRENQEGGYVARETGTRSWGCPRIYGDKFEAAGENMER
jgi:hypothetical protein